MGMKVSNIKLLYVDRDMKLLCERQRSESNWNYANKIQIWGVSERTRTRGGKDGETGTFRDEEDRVHW